MRLITFFFTTVMVFGLSVKALAQTKKFKNDSLLLEKYVVETKSAGDHNPLKLKETLQKGLHLADSLSVVTKDDYYLNRKALFLSRTAFFKRREGNNKEALKLLSQIIKIKKQLGKDEDLDFTYLQIGAIWHRFEKVDKVKEYYDSAYVANNKGILKGKPNYDIRAQILNLYGCHYANIDSMNVAESYFKKGIRLADSLHLLTTLASNSMQYAEVLQDLGRLDEALTLNKKAYKIYHKLDHNLGKASSSSSMAESYYFAGNYKDALKYSDYAMNIYKEANLKQNLVLEYPLHTAILSKIGNYKEALSNYKIYTKLKDSLQNKERYEELADLDAKLKYETKKAVDSTKMAQIVLLEKSELKRKANTKFWIVVSSLLLLLSLITIFYIIYRNRAREQALKNQLLNQEVSEKTEEITELLTETVQHIKSKERLAENLQKLSNEQEGVSLKSIIADLKASKADNAKMMLIKQNIEQVNFSFIKKLKSKHPELTKTDIEISSFIRIGLSRKEIAELRNTSIEAIKSSRFRIKKKLNLDKSLSLDDYINTL